MASSMTVFPEDGAPTSRVQIGVPAIRFPATVPRVMSTMPVSLLKKPFAMRVNNRS